jgi:hypothetical protein
MRATHILYKAAGAPSMQGSERGVCRVCDAMGTGLDFAAWVRDTFMDWDKLVPGTILCQACQFAFADDSVLLAQRLGKAKPQRMRNYSHFVVGGEWRPISKGDKRQMAAILLQQSPEVAVVALSGQKHLIFRAAPGWWQIEEQAARPFPTQLAGVLAAVESLYDSGFSKAEIETGRYAQARIIAGGLAAWRELETMVRPLRGSLVLCLALFLAQKEEDEDGSLRDGDGPADSDLAGHSGRLQEPVPGEDLAAVRGQYQKCRVHGDPEPLRQQSLFALGCADCD